MKIWITGIAGFLGSHLEKTLRDAGHDVYGNDNGICSSQDNSWVSADCCDFDAMRSLISTHGSDTLIHCAATAHEGLSNFSPSFITRNIYEASVATFSAAIAAGVKRIVFMSSMARYGNGTGPYIPYERDFSSPGHIIPLTKIGPPFTEDMDTSPIDPYGIAKVAAEDTLKALCKLHSVEYVIAVPHNIIGPAQRYNDPYRNVASIMINRALQHKPIIVYGDGKQKRCFSPVKDCLHSLVKMVDAPISGETINIGPEMGEMTILELAEIIRDLTGGASDIQHVASRPNEVKEAWCSNTKAKKLLDFNPQQSIRECLKDMVLYIKSHGTKEFEYSFPIEIEKGCPATWKDKLI